MSHSQKKRGFDRRDILKAMGLSSGTAAISGSAAAILFESLINGLFNRAMAQSTGYNARKFIYIQQSGAPARWMYDLFLTPYSTAGFISNGQLGTRYDGNNKVRYETIQRKGIQVPVMWGSNIPTPGGQVPMVNLLDNLLHIRGINALNPGHPGAQALHMRPLGAKRSVTALTSDGSDAPIKALNVNSSNYQFLSKSGYSSVFLPSNGNMIQNLLNPFLSGASSDYKQKLGSIKGSVDAATNALNNLAKSKHPASEIIANSQKDAEELINTSFGDLNAIWNQLRNKYRNLIARSLDISVSIPGITDQRIGNDGARGNQYQINGRIIQNSDLRTLFNGTQNIERMAEHFAVAEYVIANNLSESVTISPRFISGLAAVGGNANQAPDEHNVGRMPSLIINVMYYRALSSCLYELIQQLKNNGLFQDTVIDVGGEFNRSPKNNGTGSDHGWQGASCAIYSGIINGPIVLGNVFSDSPDGGHSGSWGYGAPVGGNIPLDIGHYGATIAALLNAPSPVTARPSIVQVSGNSVTPLIELARQI